MTNTSYYVAGMVPFLVVFLFRHFLGLKKSYLKKKSLMPKKLHTPFLMRERHCRGTVDAAT